MCPAATADEILEKVKCTDYNDTKDWYVRFDKKEDLPKRFHYSNSIRIEEVIGEVQTQYLAFRYSTSLYLLAIIVLYRKIN